MALVRTVTMATLASTLTEAFEYAGGKLAQLTATAVTDSGSAGATIFDGDKKVADVRKSGVYNYVVAAFSDNSHSFGIYQETTTAVKVIATKSAVAITAPDSNGVSKIGIIISTDNNNNFCCVTETVQNANLANPAVVPQDSQYTTAILYSGTTSMAFGSTALAKIPVPSFDGNARWLPNVCFAHATQYLVDGSVTLNGTQKFYCIGGSWFIDDSEGNT